VFHKGFAPRRVVVTGMGIACPLGVGVEHVWKRMLAGHSGIAAIQSFDVSALPARIAGQIPEGVKADGGLDINEWIPVKDQKKMDRFIQFAMVAADEAVVDSGWVPQDEDQRCRTGVMIGSGIGGLETIHEAASLILQGKIKRISPFFIPSALINLASGQVSIRYGFKGPNHSVVTACATGVHALGDAARLIALGDADVMVAGGAEAAVGEIGMAGFCAARALSTSFNDNPTAASRPWDEARDGFMSGDAYHITAPAEGHDGAFRAMKAALASAGITPEQIQYVNAHGTSTPLGDDLELEAVERLWGDNARGLAMSSTKSAVGHLLGAAGAVEGIFSILAIRDQVAPATLNLEKPSRESAIDRVAKEPQPRKIDIALSNSFGFGGTNASIIFRGAP